MVAMKAQCCRRNRKPRPLERLTTLAPPSLYIDESCGGCDLCFHPTEDIHPQQAINWATEWQSVRYHHNPSKLFAQRVESSYSKFRGDNIAAPCGYSLVLLALCRAETDGLKNLHRQDRKGGAYVDEQVDDFCAGWTCNSGSHDQETPSARQRVTSRQNITTKS